MGRTAIVPDSTAAVEVDGTTYLGYVLRHGGTVQLGLAKASPQVSSSTFPAGSLFLLLGAALLLSSRHRRRG